jgi:hypothetical protein
VPMNRDFSCHGAVNHSNREYVRGQFWHTNTIENYFSILKRGITGTYHHVSQQHLKRYLGEFDFRYNERIGLGVDDCERMTKATKGIVGKRLRIGGLVGTKKPTKLFRSRREKRKLAPPAAKPIRQLSLPFFDDC